MQIDETVKCFKSYLERYHAIRMAESLFHWDMQTGNPPEGGQESRAKLVSILGAESFQMTISDEMKGFLDALEPHLNTLSDETKAMHRIFSKKYNEAKNVPAEEARKYFELQAVAYEVWRKAKHNNDFASFAPYLKELVETNKRLIKYRGSDAKPYDMMLDEYEPGMTMEKLDVYFDKMRKTIVPLLKKVVASEKKIDNSFTFRTISIDKQKKIAALVMKKVGFDLNRGLIAETEHPFCLTISQNDVRISTHYYENNFLSSMFSVAHESGHGIYEQNISSEFADTVLSDGVSFGLHESQSRFFENIICRSYEFWQNSYDEFMEILGDDFKDVTPEMFYEAANVVNPSLIRIEADELTYSLHIMVRYEIEKLIFGGEVDVNDLPSIWNKKMEEYLGVTPKNDSEGVLQDVHWSSGLFGYFPSYSLGNAYAAQLLSYMQKDMDVFGNIKNGNVDAIREWLSEKLHKFGSLYEPSTILKAINGEELNADYYVEYLENKFSKVYNLK